MTAGTIATEEAMPPMARTTPKLLVVLLLFTACDPFSAPLVRHEGGYRLTPDHTVELWMGADCEGVTALEVVLSNEDEDLDLARFESTDDDGTSISHWVLAETPEGFDMVDPMDAEWNRADTVRVRIEGDDHRTSSHLMVDSFSAEASQRDGWYIQHRGWLSETGYRDLIAGEDGILPLCPIDSEPQ